MAAPPDRAGDEVSRLRRLVDHAHDIVLVVGMDGGILDANPATARVLGHPREVAVTMNVFDLVAPDDLPTVTARLEGAGDHASAPVASDARLRRSDGQWRWFEVRVEPLGDGTFALNARDAHERHRNDTLLEGQRSVLALVARGAPLGEVVAAIGEIVQELADGCRVAVVCKVDAAPLVWAPDLPAVWAREVTVGLMGARAAVEGTDALLDGLAAEHQLGSASTTTIRAPGGREIGRIVVYRSVRRPPPRSLQGALVAMADLATIAAERDAMRPGGSTGSYGGPLFARPER